MKGSDKKSPARKTGKIDVNMTAKRITRSYYMMLGKTKQR